jgi:hypothetical protein
MVRQKANKTNEENLIGGVILAIKNYNMMKITIVHNIQKTGVVISFFVLRRDLVLEIGWYLPK